VKIAPLLKGNYRIAAVDLPGFGFSDLQDAGPYCTLEEHVEAVTSFIDAVTRGPFILLGHSFGGWVSALYASQHPDRVLHLVLVDTAGIYYRGVEKLRRAFTVNSVADTRWLLNAMWFRYPWYFKPFTPAVFHELTQRHMNELVASIDAVYFLVEELGRLSMPVSIIWGKEDKVILPESIDVLMKFVAHARAAFIHECGHVPQLEKPVEFASVVQRILENVKP